ncbi:Protein FAM172A Precursor [Channa argus]|uniref:Protein FAM172A n=1 Tax=Channa argus TaxID=215402 RepID=A0A6G1PZY4_CHAAH|nr:Protein FAM172A Precursor [Channa argus]
MYQISSSSVTPTWELANLEEVRGKPSTGTERHELTSWMSFESIFRFFSEVLEAKKGEEAEESSKTVTTRSSSLKNKHQDL